jgi:hypothetical protein
LQRWSAATGIFPGAAGSSPEHAAAMGYFGTRSFTPVQTGPGAQAVPGYGSHTSPAALLSFAPSALQRAEGDEVVQREPGTPEYGSSAPAPEAPAPATSVPEETDGGAGVQGAPAAAEAAGAAAQGPAARGAAASGSPAGATPEQLDELAKRLAGPLIRRIKAEMLLDRERRGLRTDTN